MDLSNSSEVNQLFLVYLNEQMTKKKSVCIANFSYMKDSCAVSTHLSINGKRFTQTIRAWEVLRNIMQPGAILEPWKNKVKFGLEESMIPQRT